MNNQIATGRALLAGVVVSAECRHADTSPSRWRRPLFPSKALPCVIREADSGTKMEPCAISQKSRPISLEGLATKITVVENDNLSQATVAGYLPNRPAIMRTKRSFRCPESARWAHDRLAALSALLGLGLSVKNSTTALRAESWRVSFDVLPVLWCEEHPATAASPHSSIVHLARERIPPMAFVVGITR